MLLWEELWAHLEDICWDVIGGEEALPLWWHHFLQLPACPGRLRGCSGNAVWQPGWMRQKNTVGLVPSRLARSIWPRGGEFSSRMQMTRLRAVKTARQVNRFLSFTVAFIISIFSVYIRWTPRRCCRDRARYWTRTCREVGPVPHSPKGMVLLCRGS